MICPSSPPAQLKPRYGFPSIMTPPPTPVPSVISTKLSALSPFTAYSPNAAAFASFSKFTGLPSFFSSIAPNSVFFIRILHAYATIPFLLSTVPRQPIPIDLISDIWRSAPFTTSIHKFAISSTISSTGLCANVETDDLYMIRPVSSTTPAAIFVPPKSIPIYTLFSLLI